MAITPLSTDTTLGRFIALVRLRTGTLEPQESEIFDTQITDIVHQSVKLLSLKADEELYKTLETVGESGGTIDISSKSIRVLDKNKMGLTDSSHGRITILDTEEFDRKKDRYTTTELLDSIFARILNVDGKTQIEVLRGGNKSSPGTLTFRYIRNPDYVTDTEKNLDLPNNLIPEAIEDSVRFVKETIVRKA